MANWVSLRAYAAHRGVTLSSVQKAIESGRVTAVMRNSTGRLSAIDQDEADREWAGNTDPLQAARTSIAITVAPGVPAGTGDPAGSPEAARAGELPFDVPQSNASAKSPAPDDQRDYLAHRARTEEYKSKEAELTYLERVGILVSARAAHEETRLAFRQLRDKLTPSVAEALMHKLAGETDPLECRRIVNEHIVEILDECSSRFGSDAAERTEERALAHS